MGSVGFVGSTGPRGSLDPAGSSGPTGPGPDPAGTGPSASGPSSSGPSVSDDGGASGVRPLRALLRQARPHRLALAGSLLLALAASGSGLVQPLVARNVLDALADGTAVAGPLVLLGVLVVAGAVLTGLQSWWQQRTSEQVVRSIRRDLVFRLVRLKIPELDRRPPGDLVARVTSDSALVQNAATQGLVMISNGLLTVLGAVVLMGTVHLGLLGVTLGVLCGTGAVLGLVLPRIREAVARAQRSVGAVGAALDRSLGAARTVKANGAEARETARAEAAVQEAYEAGLTGAKYVALVQVLSGVAIQAAFLAVLGVGGALVAAGDLDASQLIAFLLYVFYLASPIASLLGGLGMLQQGLGAVVRIEQVRNLPAEDDVDLPEDAAAHTTGSAAPPVEFDAVHFAYPGRGPALRGVAFTVPGGTRTALVGLSGAGKTTMFALLQRFYEPDAGAIRIGGRDIAGMSRAEVRRRIAYVEQESPVMAGTLRENLRYAATGASDEAIADVLRLTRLDALVARLPDGLDTEVGNRGVALSGGERQRLAIARALLREPDVLLLDEATAQLDASNEQALREAVDQAARRCTVVLIAHRLSTVTDAEQIIVLQDGGIRAAGSHEELVGADALYRELAASQMLVPATDEGAPPGPGSVAGAGLHPTG
ncbi:MULTISPECIES: ABC transporter ATP-binding protein [Streptomyces]|uniref:ABC transporter ATP-binding protein n=1 Tax=Streptomyces TaxID=1883 RepID=UPI00081AF333|nr:ATP-binding cassette domain-containing protein [Streptomyces sp. SID4950]SCE31460.1 ATP-binding cassette, subfamily B/ATP-binding cassette, subfamily C [Streptomyces sp. SolWspMP-5a-2]